MCNESEELWEWGVYPQSPQVFSTKYFKSIVP